MQLTVKSIMQFEVWAPILGYQCIEITSSSKIQTTSFLSCAIKASVCKDHSGKNNILCHRDLPYLESIWRGFFYMETATTKFKPYTTHSSDIYSPVTLLRSFSFLVFSASTNYPTERAAYNIKFKDAKVLTVWAWQFLDKRHRSRVSITTKKLRFNCFVLDISLAGFENRTFDWLDLKMLESIVLVLPSDWF